MARTCWGVLLILSAIALSPGALAAGRRPLVCEPGRFLVESPEISPAGPKLESIVLGGDGTVTIDGCAPTHAKVQAHRGYTELHARWPRCGYRRQVRLSARIEAPECRVLVGRLKARGLRPTTVVAVRKPIEPAPGGLSALVIGGDIKLSWRLPDRASGNTKIRLLRRLNEPPVDAADPLATLVFAGRATQAVDDLRALLPGTEETPRAYHYAVFGCRPGGPCESQGSRASLAPTLAQALAGGGYVVHWRHASATVCVDALSLGTAAQTAVPGWWRSCDQSCGTTTARQLSDAGRAEATAIGEELRLRGIPFGRVVTSEFCRNIETAERMDLGPALEEAPAMTYFVYDEAARCANVQALIAESPATGTNTALIGHAGYLPECPVLSDLASGEAAIFKPDGNGNSELVTRVLWDAWSVLP